MTGTAKLMTAGGGGVNITPASSVATDVTVQVPSQNCTLGIQGPAFSAYISGTPSISATTYTKLPLNVEEFDTANCFDSTTNYRFTPNVAGYYQINGKFTTQSTTTSDFIFCTVYRNGSETSRGSHEMPALANYPTSIVCALVYLNGTTDYVELYAYSNATRNVQGGLAFTSFSSALVRAA